MYFVKIDGPEERWVTWGRWATDTSEDEGFYITKNKARACIISEEYLQDAAIIRQLESFGTYTKILANEEEVRKHRTRIFVRYI